MRHVKNFVSCISVCILLVLSSLSYADVSFSEQDVKKVVPKESAANITHHESVVGRSDDINKSADFDKSELIRCWQEGELIVAENGWLNPNNSGAVILERGNQKMSVWEFGETFCMYLGE